MLTPNLTRKSTHCKCPWKEIECWKWITRWTDFSNYTYESMLYHLYKRAINKIGFYLPLLRLGATQCYQIDPIYLVHLFKWMLSLTTIFIYILLLSHPLPTNSRNASNRPSNAAHNTGVMPSSSLWFTSRLFASFNTSSIPSFAALKWEYQLERWTILWMLVLKIRKNFFFAFVKISFRIGILFCLAIRSNQGHRIKNLK